MICKKTCICIPFGYRTTYNRLNNGVLDAEKNLHSFCLVGMPFHLCGYGLQKIPYQFINWNMYYITVAVWCHMTAKSIIRLIYFWEHKFTLVHHIYCDNLWSQFYVLYMYVFGQNKQGIITFLFSRAEPVPFVPARHIKASSAQTENNLIVFRKQHLNLTQENFNMQEELTSYMLEDHIQHLHDIRQVKSYH